MIEMMSGGKLSREELESIEQELQVAEADREVSKSQAKRIAIQRPGDAVAEEINTSDAG